MVIKAHKLLIASAIVMFVLYGLSEVRNYANGDASALLRALLAIAGAAGFGVYLRYVYVKYGSERGTTPL
jgi:hypothetical protein